MAAVIETESHTAEGKERDRREIDRAGATNQARTVRLFRNQLSRSFFVCPIRLCSLLFLLTFETSHEFPVRQQLPTTLVPRLHSNSRNRECPQVLHQRPMDLLYADPHQLSPTLADLSIYRAWLLECCRRRRGSSRRYLSHARQRSSPRVFGQRST